MTIGPHCDLAYGHAAETVNASALLCPAAGTSALVYESVPGREDWQTFDGDVGDALLFPGGAALHYSAENTTGAWRWSLDARVVAGDAMSAYDSGGYLADALCESGAWRRISPDAVGVDPRVGLPFDRGR